MKIEGLDIKEYEKSENNIIDISSDTKFAKSTILIKGNNNVIRIEDIKLVTKLDIRLSGNNKVVTISKSNKKINGLNIYAMRGDLQEIIIEENFGCGGCEIRMTDGSEKVFIGNDCLFSWGIKIRTSDGHSVVDLKTGRAINLPKNVYIGSHVWLGEDVKILKGSSIPDNCVVGSGSIVTKHFDDVNINSLIVGIPAKVIRKGITWDRRMPYIFNEEVV